ncbi:MAG: tyrosine-type recombinase/integrase [Miltoncostaeaceae bacterium]
MPLTPTMVSALRRHKLARAPDPSEDGGRVFRSATGGSIDGDNLTRAWGRALRKAGVRHVPLHLLRHLAVSRMIASNASPKTTQAVVGHASIQLTFDPHGHLLPDDLDSLAQRLGALQAVAGVTAGDTSAPRAARPGSKTTKAPSLTGLQGIAGAGFEPATFGL